MQRINRILSLLLCGLLALGCIPVQGEELTPRDAYWEYIELLNLYLTDKADAAVDINRLRTGFDAIDYQHSLEFSLYAEVLAYLASGELHLAEEWVSFLQDISSKEFNDLIASSNFQENYSCIRSVKELALYVSARRYEAQRQYASAIDCYKQCPKFFDSLSRYRALKDAHPETAAPTKTPTQRPTATPAPARSSLANQYVQRGGIVSFGSYEQDGNQWNGQEPIQWLVLERSGSRALLLSLYGLDTQPYHTYSTNINWSNCYLRTWLQTDFYFVAFDQTEQNAILTTRNSTPLYANASGSPGPETSDQVFVLSPQEVERYLPNRNDRAVRATSYALSRGASTKVDGNSYWWLRSYSDYSTQRVQIINSQCNFYASTMDDYAAVVRPSIWVDVNK